VLSRSESNGILQKIDYNCFFLEDLRIALSHLASHAQTYLSRAPITTPHGHWAERTCATRGRLGLEAKLVERSYSQRFGMVRRALLPGGRS
jgi:hypothetical protein